MRFIVRAKLPTEAGNRMVKDPNFLSNLENYIKANNVESSYFFEMNGERTMAFVLDMQSTDKIPAVAEPLFQLGASVQFHAAMNLDELKKAIQNMPKQ
jgi:hypothetical protein